MSAAAAYRAAMGALAMLALLLRTVPLWDRVFQPGFVNFQETDAWYHIRLIDYLVRNFPLPLRWDAYSLYPNGQAVLVGPFFDWMIGAAAWVAGLGQPSERLVHGMAAVYPAVLGTLAVAACGALARHLAGRVAGLCAMGIAALLPGHFHAVTSLGFTDHHAMESLLSVLIPWLLLRAQDGPEQKSRAVLAGVALAAYVLTFTGAALFVAVLVGWACWEQIGGTKPVEPLVIAFRTALPAALLFLPLLWMEYTLLVLVAGVLGPPLVGAVRARRRWWIPAIVGLVAAVGLALLQPMVQVMLRQLTATSEASRTVGELRSLAYAKGFFSLEGAWRQLAGALPLALAGLAAFGPRYGLVTLWTVVAMVMAGLQTRMVYYAAPMAAVFAGIAAARFLKQGGAARWVGAAFLVGAIAVPGLTHAVDPPERAGALTPEWLSALEWMRKNTPEPFGDPDAYYRKQVQGPGYGVLAWWDFGYFLTAVGRRVPLTNPAQTNAGIVARFFLATSEQEAMAAVGAGAPRYVMVDGSLPLSGGVPSYGMFPALFAYADNKRAADFMELVTMQGADGTWQEATVFRPAYYRSMAVRLGAFGGEAAAAGKGVMVCMEAREKRVTRYRLVEGGGPEKEAGCELVGLDPRVSPVTLEAVRGWRRVRGGVSTVQIFAAAGM